jgi:bifunctional UDP-N-acetylglucosamine pyrophosphorylase/glucosamine-1-phosphate N-acetyltransferase
VADEKLAAVILAAGQSKRMGGVAKVLCRSGGRTLIDSVIAAARAAGASRIVCVLGHEKDKVAAALPAGVEWVEQKERLGTGHAAMQAEPLLKSFPGEVLVLCGDTPLLRSATLARLVEMVRKDRAAAAVMTFDAPAGSAYGRIIREKTCPTTEDTEGHRGQQQPASSCCSCCNKGKKQPLSSVSSVSSVVNSVVGGRVLRIVEAKDASPEELAGREVNSGSYCFRAGELFARLARLTNRNAQGEYYLTDVVGLLIADGLGVAALKTDDPDEALGVNSPEDLAAVEAAVARRAARPAGGT